jgi:GT2 family glycosyltransferase/SAM-dependent methyltransferase
MAVAGSGLKLGFVEPHLGRVGGIRRVVEFANRLVARGHEVAFLLPDGEVLGCSWMPCAARVVPLSEAVGESWDVVVFNHEPQWFWLERFSGARRRVFYALHDGSLYGKEGSWEAAWAPVDVQLANSRWTAERIAGVHGGAVPLVQLGGVNREVFSPWGVPKRHRVLCSGVTKAWKGTDTIREACASLGVPLGEYAPLDLSQEALGREYASAEVFVVGSWYEGFCQPGLEALACGVPLVTTDNGGCLEYAIDGETALVVPPRDAGAMAEAIGRLLDDRVLAQRLASNGLELVARDFDWERRTDELEERLDGVVAGSVSAPPPPRPAPPECPELSVVVLAWDNLLYTQRFAQTVRANTEVGYELIIVDNGSAPEPASYASQAADVAIMNDANLGFAKGMNQGLVAARGEWVAFCNNDTLLPEGWAAMLLDTARAHPEAGIIVPALTAARNPVTVRDTPGDTVEVIDRFSAPPAAVIYLMRRDVAEALAGWGEDYEVASGEDVDLAFKVWTNDLEIVYDSRVLVDHIGKGSASRLDNWQELWAKNRQYFLTKWQDPATEIPRIASCSPERHATNQATARATAGWMQKYFDARDRPWGKRPAELVKAGPEELKAKARRKAVRAWHQARPHLPPPVVQAARSTRRAVDDREARLAAVRHAVAEPVRRVAPAQAKQLNELRFWLRKKRREGSFHNDHYATFFTEPFGLTADDFVDKALLDVGCGPRGSLEWADRASERYGLDPLARVYSLLSPEHAMSYVAAPCEAIPFPDAHFDVVSSFNSLDHVDDLPAAVGEITRVLKPGGHLLLITDFGHEPTTCEPQAFGLEILDLLGERFEVERSDTYAKGTKGIYRSITEGTPQPVGALPSGVLVGRLRRQA